MSIDVEACYEKIYRYCYLKVKHRQTAEDITQETFLRFIEQNSYQEMGKKLAYLYVIARNLCTDFYRQKPVEEFREEELLQEESTSGLIDSITVKQALSELPEDDQELLFLRYVNELSIQYIAEFLNISRFSIYRRTKVALKQLKEKLGKEDWT